MHVRCLMKCWWRMLLVEHGGRSLSLFKLEMKLEDSSSNSVGSIACMMGSMFSLPAPVFGKAWSFSLICTNIQENFPTLCWIAVNYNLKLARVLFLCRTVILYTSNLPRANDFELLLGHQPNFHCHKPWCLEPVLC
jgi:hypothetical protein